MAVCKPCSKVRLDGLLRQANKKNRGWRSLRGADGRTRTGDLLITNQLLYQLSYVGMARGARDRPGFAGGPIRPSPGPRVPDSLPSA